MVDYGWLTMVAAPLFWVLDLIHRLIGNWGWSIIGLTVLIKGAFFPLSAASQSIILDVLNLALLVLAIGMPFYAWMRAHSPTA